MKKSKVSRLKSKVTRDVGRRSPDTRPQTPDSRLPAISPLPPHESHAGPLKSTKLLLLPAAQLVTLKRNPQFQTPAQMDGLKESIKRDGFVAPILVRPLKKNRYEVVSGNHRFMAACELGLKEIPCVISDMTDAAAKRLAINLNTIHGEPNVELLAPFLAELDLDTLREIHIEEDVKLELIDFDQNLAAMLAQLEPPAKMNRESPQHSNDTCKCAKCGATHVARKG